MSHGPVTRGHGLLETWLARRRAAVADRLIPEALRDGRILDIGSGSFPYFLSRTRFRDKVGIDKLIPPGGLSDRSHRPIRMVYYDVETDPRLPVADASCSVVSMLAVFEHIRLARLIDMLNDIDRVLARGGAYIFTTPAGWTGPILTMLSRLSLVSPIEIGEHQASYSRRMIRGIINQSSLGGKPLTMGAFELGMNTWGVIRT
jgi:SAM-dependent methyltransferase